MKSFLKKFAAGLLLAGFIFQPLGAMAALDPTTVPVADSALGIGGLVGEGLVAAVTAATTAAEVKNTACEVLEKGFGIGDHVSDFALGGLTMIGGSAAEQVLLEKKIATIEGFLVCRTAALALAKAIPAQNTFGANKKQLLENKISAAIDTLEQKKTSVMAEARIAKRGFWKSLVLSTLLKTTKVIAKKMANELTSTYKIKDFQRYADVVGSQVYATQLIQNTATDKNEQLIMRSLINNPLAQSQISSAIQQRADQSLALDLVNYNVKNANYYADMASVGAGPNNAFTLNVMKSDKAASIASKGKSDAERELQQSVGLKAPRTCKGDIAQQKDIDKTYELAEKKYDDRMKLYQNLKNTKDTISGLSEQQAKQLDVDLKKAKDDWDAASNALDKLPQSFDAPVLTICESIVSPATSIDKGITGAFGFFDKNMSDYNSDHLPFFVNFVGGLVSEISSSLIFGGSPEKAILREEGNINKSIGLAVSAASSGGNTDLSGGIVFESEKSSNAADAYVINWDAQAVTDGASVTITGSGVVGPSNLPVSGSMEIHTSANGTYVLKVLSKTGSVLKTSSFELKVSSLAQVNLRGSMVAGANTVFQPVYIRGK